MSKPLTQIEDFRLGRLHNMLENNGFDRSKLSESDQKELLELETKWTDFTDQFFEGN